MRIKRNPLKSINIVAILLLFSICVILSGCNSLDEQNVISNAEIAKTVEKVEKVVYHEEGEQRIIYLEREDGIEIVNLLARTLHGINSVMECYWTKEQVQEIKEKTRCIELIFKNPTDVKISRWDEIDGVRRYQIMEDVRYLLFVLEDGVYNCEEATILLDWELGGNIYWSGCSIIKQQKKDTSWVQRLEEMIKE